MKLAHADGGDVRLGVGVIGEPQEETRLSDTRVANEEKLGSAKARRNDAGGDSETHFEEVIVFCRRHDECEEG